MTPDHCILLVEDNADDAMLVERAMLKANITAPLHRVEDGEAACNYLAGNGPYADRVKYPLPTLVLLDIKLPKRSGLEVLRWMRGTPALPKIIVVMLTSSSEHRDIAEAYAHGVNSYLVKPISPLEMQGLIKSLGLYWLNHNQPPPVG